MEDYESDGEAADSGSKRRNDDVDDEEEKEDYSLRVLQDSAMREGPFSHLCLFQIFYCSRTHSQLSQFVKEIQKSPFSESVRLVSLASRNIMCINESVKGLGGSAMVNERCLEMQRNKGTKSAAKDDGDGKAVRQRRTKKPGGGGGKCPFHKQSAVENLRDQALLKVLDIEELASHGKRLNACPYYASRRAASDAQIIGGFSFRCYCGSELDFSQGY